MTYNRNISTLTIVPVSDGNYTAALRRATDEELRMSRDVLYTEFIHEGKPHKGRIKAVEREIQRREKEARTK